MTCILPFLGTKYQEFQITEMADVAQFPEPEATAVDRNTTPKQLDGALVSYAFPDAKCFSVSQRV